ncbi:MAG: DUF5681 domain-containing protein [Candidatus Acidiferrales bacterium]
MPVGRRFQKGVSGNPGGRPRSAVLSKAVREKLAEVVPGEDGTYAEKIADALVRKAARGDAECFRALADRSEGKPSQSVEVTTSTSNIESLFVLMTRRELRTYAETGVLPERLTEKENHENEHAEA